MLAVNKWDLEPEVGLDEEEATRKVRHAFKFATYAPLCFVSSLRRTGVRELLDTAHAVYRRWSTGLPASLTATVQPGVSVPENAAKTSSTLEADTWAVASVGSDPSTKRNAAEERNERRIAIMLHLG